MTTLQLTGPHGSLEVYEARPVGPGPFPGVIVIHDVFGLTNDLRRQCDWLAAEGFLALGPNLFSRGSTVSCLKTIFMNLKHRRGDNFDDIEFVRGHLVADPGCSGRVGIVGYCMGGEFSLALAPSGDYAVANVNYGAVPDDADTFLRTSCPIVANFGGRDRRLRGADRRLRGALNAAGVANDIKEYPDATHGFLNHHDGTAAVLARVMGPLMGGLRYDEDAATDAKRRILVFLRRYLAST